MLSRIPLSVVLSSSGQRHAIPHVTLRLPVDSDFFTYLDSDDTRLPNHPYLNGRGVDATEYDTYVGEDVWNEPGNLVTEESSDDDAAEAEGSRGTKRVRHANLVFDDVVEWLVGVLDTNEWARDGVVVCGAYAVADDATWAVPSRSPTVYTPREAFMVMRCSCKFLKDIHTQRRRHGGGDGTAMGEITIAQAMAGSAAKEMRAFVPYRLTRAPTGEGQRAREDGNVHGAEGGSFAGWCLSPPNYGYVGVCQRHTDVCFPSLMAWSEGDHATHFSLILERLRKSQLLARTCEANPSFLPDLIARWSRQQKRLGKSPLPDHGFCLFLAVDVLFESASLPIPLLSAKVRLFAARELEEPAFDGLPVAPYLVQPPAEDEEQRTEQQPSPPKSAEGVSDAVPNGKEEEDVDEDDDQEDDTTTFFRLFRNEFNWNHYVEEMEDRWEGAAHDAVTLLDRTTTTTNTAPNQTSAAIPASVLSDVKVPHYCVVASEATDLVTCGDTLTKRGLPLELLHPELLQGNQEGIAFLKGLSEKLLQEARQPR